MPKDKYSGRLGDLERTAQKVGQMVGLACHKEFGERVGFVLHLATFGTEGWATYVSNQERAGTIRMLEDLLRMIQGDDRDLRRRYQNDPTFNAAVAHLCAAKNPTEVISILERMRGYTEDQRLEPDDRS